MALIRMNYSVEAKRQLCDVPTEGYELPLLSAIVHTCALLSRDSSGLKIKLISANRYLGGTVENSVKKIAPEISVEKRGRETVLSGNTLEFLCRLGIMDVSKDGTLMLANELPKAITKKDEDKRAYLRGAFLGGGSLSVSAWHLEIGVTNAAYARSLRTLVSDYGLNTHIFERKGKYIVYLKKRENICDFLALIGATKVMLDLTQKLAENKTRRDSFARTNLELSNMQRTIDVGVVQAENIRLIESCMGLSKLGDKLYEVAKLRLADESLSYDDIAARLSISKGSVRYRFSKIAELAETLRKKDGLK